MTVVAVLFSAIDYCVSEKSKQTIILKQESRAVAREPRDAAAVVFGLKFADNIHYKFE